MTPNLVKVCGVEYPITYKNCVVEDGEVCYGYFDPSKGAVVLDNSVSDSIQKITMIHEILHALEFHYCIDELKDERVVERLSKAIYQLLRDNPDGVKWLME